MRSRLLSVLALLALSTAGFAIEQPPEPKSETQISFEVRVVTVPADACPMEEGEIAFLTDAQLKAAIEAAQGDRRVNVMQAPKITAFEGQEAVVKATQQEMFATGVEAKRINGAVSVVPKNTTVETGMVLKVRGAVSADRKFVTAKVDYQDTRIEGGAELIPVTTMITPVFEGGSQGKPIPFTQFLQVPQVGTIKVVKADLRIPSGGNVAIAGPTFIQEVREETAKSALGNIPYVGRMVRKVTYSKVSMRTVLIVTPRVLEELSIAPKR
jgi:type II secretory pathway component GspD/PulD (secretin)